MALTFSRITLAGPLLTIADAKTHLRIYDAAHDTEVTETLAAAEEAILAYLGLAADATWTPATAPVAVTRAIRLLLAHYYEHRGDEFGPGQDNDDRVWKAVANLLSQYRDPTLA